MHFSSGRWKLIDMDGMVTTGKQCDAGDVFYTSFYCSPEFADMMNKQLEVLDVTRHFDVWSLGMTFCELVTLEPVMCWKYDEFENGDDFMPWLADPATGEVE